MYNNYNEYLFENLQKMHEVEENENLRELYEMAKLVPKYANKENTNNLNVTIFFSQSLGSHGPRIKFDGGNDKEKDTRKMPTYTFGINGAKELILQDWMNKKNTPNAFDKDVLNNVINFINATLSLLLLTWFRKLDEATTLNYFQGFILFNDILKEIEVNDEILEKEILKVKNLKELHDFCKRANLYTI